MDSPERQAGNHLRVPISNWKRKFGREHRERFRSLEFTVKSIDELFVGQRITFKPKDDPNDNRALLAIIESIKPNEECFLVKCKEDNE